MCVEFFEKRSFNTKLSLLLMARSNKFPNDHKRIKGWLKAPMNFLLQDSGWNVSYQQIDFEKEILPEILWLHYLNISIGIGMASKVLEVLVKNANRIHSSKQIISGLVSSFGYLDKGEQLMLKKSLPSELVDALNFSLIDLYHLFPELPIGFILHKEIGYQIGSLPILKDNLKKLYDRSSKETTYALAHVVYPLIIERKFEVSSNIKIHPKYLLDYPESEDSLLVAGTIRNSVRLLVGQNRNSHSNKWTSYFWSRCLQLEPCKL